MFFRFPLKTTPKIQQGSRVPSKTRTHTQMEAACLKVHFLFPLCSQFPVLPSGAFFEDATFIFRARPQNFGPKGSLSCPCSCCLPAAPFPSQAPATSDQLFRCPGALRKENLFGVSLKPWTRLAMEKRDALNQVHFSWSILKGKQTGVSEKKQRFCFSRPSNSAAKLE